MSLKVMRHNRIRRGSGFTLIEVLVTVLIIAIGLLGLASLQMTTLNNQLEAYQRAQALLLAEEMVNRMRVNSREARDNRYTEGEEYGLASQNCASLDPNDPSTFRADVDLCEWNNALKGTGMKLAGGEDIGGAVGARGCIKNVTIGESWDNETIIRISIAWLGMSPTVAPAADSDRSDCGEGAYGDEKYRRTISMDAVLANIL